MFRKLVLFSVVILIGLGVFVSADFNDKQNIIYTPSTETSCLNGICNKVLYSGVKFVEEDSQWKRVENVQSLKGKGFDIIYLENDEKYPIEVLDFNYSSITLKFNPKGFKIFSEDVPLRVWDIKDENSSKKDFKNTYGKIKDENITFGLLEQEEIRTYDFGMGKILEFGFNSTTIILQDADTENLEDAPVLSHFDTVNYGNAVSLNLCGGTSNFQSSFFRFNISSIPAEATIESVVLRLYYKTEGIDSGESYSTFPCLYNTTWTEETIKYENIDYSKFVLCGPNDWLVVGASPTPAYPSWINYSVTHIFNYSYLQGDKNVSIVINATQVTGDASSFDDVEFWSKEYTMFPALRPYLNVTYSVDESEDTCACAGLNENWEIDMSDYCNITENCNLGTGKLNFTGEGITRINATINTSDLGDPNNLGVLSILNNCVINIK